jgi:Uncharacterized protein conserved in bacteria
MIVLLFLIGCGQAKSVNLEDLQDRNGVYFEVNSEKPFTGNVIVATHDNDQIYIEAEYKNGLLDGTETKYFENGVKESVINYRKGVVHGLYILYGEKGNMLIERNFTNGVIDGQMTTYFEDGTKETILNYKNSILHGENIEYYENGEVALEGIYKDGIFYVEGDDVPFTGKLIVNFLNDNPRIEKDFVNGLLHGKDKAYYESGKVSHEKNYINGVQDGLSTYYRENGEILSQLKYKDGKIIYD